VVANAKADPRYAAVDEALAVWRQGDCVLGEHWFAHRLDPSFPISGAARDVAAQNVDLAEEPVVGLVVVTQTCDIVRPCAERAFVEVCPIVEVDATRLREIESGRRPAYGFLPLLAERNLVADLDRSMTVEKPVVAKWTRTPSWSIDDQARTFATALARKRARFPFPDDFTAFAKKLQSRLTEKHGRESPEGAALRGLREIRVQAAPSWDGPTVTLTFWFVRRDEDEVPSDGWSALLDMWLRHVPAGGRFAKVQGQVTKLEDITAADYVGSDPLDLDHLSIRTEPE
jgi:hypothetical protein